MKLSDFLLDRVKAIPPSAIRKNFDIINEMKDVISLGIGEPDFATPWDIIESGVYSLEKGHTHYSPNPGFKELRYLISEYQKKRYGLKYDPDSEIIVTVGASEAIDVSLRSFVEVGDEVIIPEPSFVCYKPLITITGATPVTIDLKSENNFKLMAKDLLSAITDRTKVLILSFPNNPTGAVMTKEDLEPIVNVLKDKDILVISDEIYSELTYEGHHTSIASFKEMKDKTIVINGFSKSFAMTGWRVGYVCGNCEFIEAMKKIHQYSIMCAPTVAQYAAIEALKSNENNVTIMKTEYNRRRRVMVDGFNKIGLPCFEPLGAFYVFPSIKSTGLSSEDFSQRLLRETKVLVVQGNAFGNCGEGFIRVTYSNSMENIIEAMKRVKEFIEAL
ncbi:MAG TPA: aminotransferase class I/II-fold pyridoxal phosphate-dependent enzyme [Clostridiaceae bacterium]